MSNREWTDAEVLAMLLVELIFSLVDYYIRRESFPSRLYNHVNNACPAFLVKTLSILQLNGKLRDWY